MKLTWNTARTVVTDEAGNSATVMFWATHEVAEASLVTLCGCHNCHNCRNCHSCHNCRNCRDCHDCHDCTDCYNCYNCHNCRNCHNCHNCHDCQHCQHCHDVRQIEGALIVGPVRSDGFQFVASESGSVHAGCRFFEDFDAARTHWQNTRAGTPLGDETFAILDFLENQYKIRRI